MTVAGKRLHSCPSRGLYRLSRSPSVFVIRCCAADVHSSSTQRASDSELTIFNSEYVQLCLLSLFARDGKVMNGRIDAFIARFGRPLVSHSLIRLFVTAALQDRLVVDREWLLNNCSNALLVPRSRVPAKLGRTALFGRTRLEINTREH